MNEYVRNAISISAPYAVIKTIQWRCAGGQANGADHEQGVVQHEHGRARREAGTVSRHGDAFDGQPQGVRRNPNALSAVAVCRCTAVWDEYNNSYRTAVYNGLKTPFVAVVEVFVVLILMHQYRCSTTCAPVERCQRGTVERCLSAVRCWLGHGQIDASCCGCERDTCVGTACTVDENVLQRVSTGSLRTVVRCLSTCVCVPGTTWPLFDYVLLAARQPAYCMVQSCD